APEGDELVLQLLGQLAHAGGQACDDVRRVTPGHVPDGHLVVRNDQIEVGEADGRLRGVHHTNVAPSGPRDTAWAVMSHHADARGPTDRANRPTAPRPTPSEQVVPPPLAYRRDDVLHLLRPGARGHEQRVGRVHDHD